MTRTTRLKARNPEKRKKKRDRYAAHLRSPYFRALRMERFELDDFRCTAVLHAIGYEEARCPMGDFTRTGFGLAAHHVTYARFGRELIEDIRTICTPCHERLHALEGKRIR